MKTRIKNVLRFKKPATWLLVVSFLVVSVFLVGFISNRSSAAANLDNALSISSDIANTHYEPREWLDYYGEQLPWGEKMTLELPEYQDTMFQWEPDGVTVITTVQGERKLFGGVGAYVSNVYFADLNGDELPELCATVSFGSGMMDTRVFVYDYINDTRYELSDRAYYDYALSIEKGQLAVTQTSNMEANRGDKLGTGHLAIINDALVVFGLDRTLPTGEEVMQSNAILPQIMHDGILYYFDVNGQLEISVSPSLDSPKITSTVPSTGIPQENGQANFEGSDFGGFGALYVTYEGGLLVYWDDRWAKFVPLEQLP